MPRTNTRSRITPKRHVGAGVAAALTLAPVGAAAAPLIPRTAEEWGGFTFNVMLATGILLALLFVARSSWRTRRQQAEEAARASGEPVDADWRYRITATWSWAVSVVAIGITAFTGAKGGLPVSLLGCALILAGPFLATYAVIGASSPARKKVLLPAAFGALIPMLLICTAAAQFMLPERPPPAAEPAPAPAPD